MPLDPETAALMAEVAGGPGAALGAMTVNQTRLMARARDNGTPEPVARVVDQHVPGPAGPIPVRIYYPAAAPHDGAPACLYFHGGGWTVCDLETHDPTCRRLANSSGAVAISVDYRLAPEHKFPAAVEDALAATQWVLRQGPSIGVDPARVAVMGDSAGGNLATVAALLLRDQPAGLPGLRAQVLIVPVTEYLPDNSSYRDNAEGYFLTKAAMIWFFGHYLGDESHQRDWRAFPSLAPSLDRLPPALVLTAEFDPLRDEGVAYAERLKRAGVETELDRYEGTIHQFVIFADRLPQGRKATARIGEFLKSRLA